MKIFINFTSSLTDGILSLFYGDYSDGYVMGSHGKLNVCFLDESWYEAPFHLPPRTFWMLWFYFQHFHLFIYY